METRYYMENGHYMKLEIDYDEYCEDPREWDHFCTFAAWFGWYGRDRLGDDTGFDSVEDALQHLVRDNVTEKQIISFIRRGKTAMYVEYDRHTREWNLYNKYEYNDHFGHKKGDNYLVNSTDQKLDWLVDDMIDELTASEGVALLEEYTDMVFLPLNAADYGCNGYRCRVNNYRGFDDCNGLAWTDKKTITDCMLTEKNWKDRAYGIMEGEVEEYDIWLQGECYFAQWYQYDFENRDWIDYESCGGFLTDECGDNLFKLIADTDHKMYENFEDLYRGIA